MSYGIEIISNNGNKLIVSEKFSAYHFMGDAVYQGGRQWRINTGLGGITYYPLPFVVSGGNFATVEAIVEVGGGVWDIYVRQGSGLPSRVLVFQPLPNWGPASGWGMQVMRADGRVAFDTTRKPLYLRAVHDLTPYGSSAAVPSSTIPWLSSPAVFSACSGVIRQLVYGTTQDVYTDSVLGVRVSGNQLQYGYLPTYTFISNHAAVESFAEPNIFEDTVVNAVVSVIDAAIY